MSASLYEAIKQLSDAMVAGKLDSRGDTAGLKDRDAETILLINAMIDALISPMRLAGNALDEIAHGRLPPFVIDDYQGEYNKIKQNINTLLAILYGLHGETEHLINSVSQGKLKTRGNDWDYEGIWKELINGMNTTLDVVIAPINEAGAVLDRLAHYDLNARMNGKYRGEHATIRKAMNSTAESLHESISQVSETVGLVSEVGKQITRISSVVTKGAEEQSVQLNEASMSLASLSDSASHSAKSTAEAHNNAKLATDAILKAKESMNRMLASMNDISGAAKDTTSIANEIDGIAKETGTLAGGAVEKAVRMRISAGGFGVVAQEIRKLSRQCSETANAMKAFEKKMSEDQREEFGELITNLMSIARFSNLLGVNAAIEAAHVEGAGNEFKLMTDEIHNLAVRSADSANKTSALTKSSATLSKNGVQLSQEIARQLEEAVQGAHALSVFSDDISASIHEQTAGLEQISQTASQISIVTDKNAEGAAESLDAAKNLEKQVDKLTKMVSRFSF
ncbi:MAG: methyl-accepting chemotaxis protein [Desulfuromonadaceae bacterium]|nr:methyl-accepting chemotaxis protein [Desulfuromonadaceae bacterium]MDD2854651.1 methyl-accepting chemotaxis protein [Desulfuromonadaceae bacterium]